MTATPSDAQARELALDLSHSCVVRAPAGSGKTELLLQRFLAALCSVDSPQQCLVLTFTNKSAEELRDRLAKVIGNPQQETPLGRLAQQACTYAQQRQWALTDHPHQFSVSTIDGYFLQLFHQLSPGCHHFTLHSCPELLLSQIVQEFLTLQIAPPGHPAVLHCCQDLNNSLPHFHHLLTHLLAQREQWCLWLRDSEGRTRPWDDIFNPRISLLKRSTRSGWNSCCQLFKLC